MSRASLGVLGALLLAGGACGPRSRLRLGEAPEGEVVEAVGEVLTDRSDMPGTKGRSLVEAQKKAVEMVIGVHVSARTLVERHVEVEARILAKTDGYLRKYDVLKEWEEGPYYKTRIRALVSTRQVAQDLKALGLLKEPHVGHPRVAVLLEEPQGGGQEGAAASSALAQALLDKGYRVVDRAEAGTARARAVAASVGRGDSSGVAALGQELDAEVIVFGAVQGAAQDVRGLGGLASHRVTLSAQAYRVRGKEVLLTVRQAASGLDTTREAAALKAFAEAGRLAGEELAGGLARELSRRAFLMVTIDGVAGLDRLRDVERVISAVPGVGDFYLRGFSQGRARLDVLMQGASPRDLAAALERSSAARAKVKAVTNETLEVVLE